MTNQSGVYLNPNDIRFSFLINREIGTNCSNEDLIEWFHFKYFKKVKHKDVYKYNFSKYSVFDKINKRKKPVLFVIFVKKLDQ